MKRLTSIPLLWRAMFLFLVGALLLLGFVELGAALRVVLAIAAVIALAVLTAELLARSTTLEAKQGCFDRLVSQSPFGLIFMEERADGVLVITDLNESAQTMLGGGIPLQKGRPVEESLPGLLGTVVPRRFAEVARRGGTVVFDGLPYEQAGVSGVFDVVAFPLEQGSIVVSVFDATSRLLLAETVRRRESELALIVDGVVDAILIADADGRLLYANHAACGMTGYTVSELQRMMLAELLSPEEKARLENAVAAIFDDEAGIDEWQMRRKDGSGFPAELALRLLPDGRRLAMARDISDRKRDEERLRLAASVFSSAHEAIIITNAAGAIIDVNEAFCTLTGYSRSEVIGRNPRILQSGRHDATFYRELWRKLRETGYWGGEIWNQRRDGEAYLQLNSIAAVKDRHGDITHYVGMSFDITQRKEDELALRGHRDNLQELVHVQVADLVRAKEDAERANSAKSEFLTNMSHELRTPMHAILGFSELGGPAVAANPAKAVDYFNSIHMSGKRLLGLLNDLLDLSKLEAGRTVLMRGPVELDEVVRAIFGELLPLATRRHIQLKLGVLADDPVIDGDRRQLEQVVRNLVSNALRFSPDGGVVEVAVEEARLLVDGHESLVANALRLSVADRGPGIPTAELDAIFDKFVQSSLTRDGSGGTGLGLSISREIVQLHSGRVIATNRLDGGALFEVLLPRNPGEAGAVAVPSEPTFV